MPLHRVEHPNSCKPDWANTKRIAKRFSPVPFNEPDFDAWAEGQVVAAKAA